MCHFPAAVKREASVETGDTIAFLYACWFDAKEGRAIAQIGGRVSK